MQFEIQKDLMSSLPDLPDDLRSLRIKQFHSDLDKRLFPPEQLQKIQHLSSARKVAGNDHILTQNEHLPLFHLIFQFRIFS